MSRSFKGLDEYGLSSDDDATINKQRQSPSVPNITRRNVRISSSYSSNANKHSSPAAMGNTMSPKSKYDNRPRNVEFDGSQFVHSRRSAPGFVSSTQHQSKNDNNNMDVGVASSISIAELEQTGVKGQIERRFGRRGVHSGVVEESKGRERGSGQLLLKWLSEVEMWKVVITGCVLGVAFGMIYRGTTEGGGLYLGLSPKGQFECGVRSIKSRELSLTAVQELLPESHKGTVVLKHFLYLVFFNPHWNIVWLDSGGKKVTDWYRDVVTTDHLVSTTPSLSYKCAVSKFFGELWNKMKLVTLVVLAIAVLVVFVRWEVERRRVAERNKFLMIDKILGVLRRHYETSKRKKNLLPYLAIIHVRDMLISPSERKYQLDTWEKACQWIAKYESRVRVERQRIAGEDFDVWKWIQIDPPQTEEPVLTSNPADSCNTTHSNNRNGTDTSISSGVNPANNDFDGGGATATETAATSVNSRGSTPSSLQRKKNWYSGTTFEDDSGKRSSQMNSSYGSPSLCIRVKNMFEAVRHMSDEQSKEIEDSVLDRCGPHGNVVHIYVDRRSPYGCVYLKMDSVESAVGAYKALHGGWYKGKLVTGKYIPLEKYHKWFPAALNATEHIQPSA